MQAYPPRTDRPAELELMLAMLSSVVVGRSATYLSAPITSGSRFLSWSAGLARGFDASDPEHCAGWVREVIGPNRKQAQGLAGRLRAELGEPLIDPTRVDDLPGWHQGDYRAMWARVIEQYAERVVFVDGWATSSGCAYEFLVACRSGARTFDQDLRPLAAEDGLGLLRAAIAELRACGQPTAFLDGVAGDLERLLAARA